MSLFNAVWPLKDLGDLTKKGEHAASLVLAVALPVCAAGAASVIAADGLKAPTYAARVIVGAALGAAVAGTATTGLSGNRFPALALLSLGLGAVLGLVGAASLAPPASSDRERRAPRPTDGGARDAAAEAARPQQRPSVSAPAEAPAAPAVGAPAAAAPAAAAEAASAPAAASASVKPEAPEAIERKASLVEERRAIFGEAAPLSPAGGGVRSGGIVRQPSSSLAERRAIFESPQSPSRDSPAAAIAPKGSAVGGSVG